METARQTTIYGCNTVLVVTWSLLELHKRRASPQSLPLIRVQGHRHGPERYVTLWDVGCFQSLHDCLSSASTIHAVMRQLSRCMLGSPGQASDKPITQNVSHTCQACA